jgi:WD40 repeat protein
MSATAGIFISYARDDDQPFVEMLYRDLTGAGLGIWWDREAMASRGRTFLQEIREAVSSVSRLILVLGPKALESDYVRAEWELALELCIPVVPILRRGELACLPSRLSRLHCLDFRPARSYRQAVAELIRVLKQPIPPLAPLLGVDGLPAHYLTRTAELARLTELLLADVFRPTVITSSQQTASLQGMAGIGKSVLAAAFARACETRRAFEDAIVWLRIGPQPELLVLLQRLGEIIQDSRLQQSSSLPIARAALSNAMQQRSYLLVLDDVWDITHAEIFLNGLGPRCRLIMTTRDGGLARSLGAEELSLDVLSDEQALLLLASWAGQAVANLPQTAREVADGCGNLPLALAMVGAMIRGNAARWEAVLRKLRGPDLQRIRRRFPNYPYPDLFRALEVSLEALAPKERSAYLDFAVFRDGMPVPESAAAAMWSTCGIDADEALDIIDLFVERSLVRRNQKNSVVLHNLQAEFVRSLVNDPQALHRRLLAGYRALCSNGWSTGPDDGYFFQWLPYHMSHAGEPDELAALLTGFDWLAAKLQAAGVQSLYSDFNLIGKRPDIRALQQALELSSHVLLYDKEQLPAQLFGRLLGSEDDRLKFLLEEALRLTGGFWLRPLAACLEAPGGARIATLGGHSDRVNAVAVTPNGSLAVSASRDQTLKVWDLTELRLLHTLSGHVDEINAVAVTADGQFALSGAGKARPFKMERQISAFLENVDLRSSRDMSIRIWDLRTGKEVRQLEGHTAAVRCLMLIDRGKGLVSGGDDSTLWLWDWREGTGLSLGPQGGRVVLLAERISEGEIFTFSEFNFKSWNFRSGRVAEGTIGTWFNPLTMDPMNLKIFLQGESINGGSFDLLVWDLLHEDPATEKLDSVATFETYISAAACWPERKTVVIGRRDGEISSIDWQNGKVIHTMRGHREEVTGLALSADGSRMVSSSHDGNLIVWDLTAAATDSDRDLRHVDVWGLAMTEDLTVSASADGAIRVWKTRTGELLHTHWRTEDPVLDVRALRDGAHAVAGFRSGKVGVLSFEDGKMMWAAQGHGGWITSLAVDQKNTIAVSAARDHTLKVWDLQRRCEIATLEGHSCGVQAVTLLSEPLRAVSGDEEGELLVWDLDRGRKAARLPRPRRVDGGNAARRLWELTGPEMRSAQRKGNAIVGLAALSDGAHVVSGSADGSLRIWDVGRRVQTAVLGESAAPIRSIALSPDGRLLVSGDADGALQVWDVGRRRVLTRFMFDGACSCCDIGADLCTVAVGLGGARHVGFLRLEGLAEVTPMIGAAT